MAHHLTGSVIYANNVPAAFCAYVERRAPRSIALSGGQTAEACYSAMVPSTYRPESVWFSDERWVELHSRDSNEGNARRAWLDSIESSVHSLRGTAPTILEAALGANRELGSVAPLELAHFGLGADGHTASLFPGMVNDDEPDWITIAADSDHPYQRLTWTVRAVRQRVLHRVVTVAGEQKREAWERVCAGADLPAQCLNLPSTVWIVEDRLRDPSSVRSGP